MDKHAFRFWLSDRYLTLNNRYLDSRTIDSRVANCSTVEAVEGDLDQHFNRDRMKDLLNRLRYTKRDQREELPARHSIPINGDIYNGTSTLKSAVLLYKRFREAEVEPLMVDVARPSGPILDRRVQ